MKPYLIPRIRTIFVEKYGTAPFVLVHQARVPEVRNQITPALDSGIREGRHLLAVEFFPSFAVKRLQNKVMSPVSCQHTAFSWKEQGKAVNLLQDTSKTYKKNAYKKQNTMQYLRILLK